MKKILLIIKAKENLNLLRQHLESEYEVQTFENNLKQDKFDMCIADIAMYEENKEFIQKIKINTLPLFLPLLLITPRNFATKVSKFLGGEIDEYIVAPVEKFELSARINNLFRMQDMTIQLKNFNIDLESKISERTKEVQEKKQLLSAILDNVQNSIAAFISIRDEQNKIIDFECVLSNPLNDYLMNYPKGEYVGNNLLTKDNGAYIFEKCVSVVNTGLSIEYEHCFLVGNNDVWVHGAIAKLGDGFVSTHIDITNQKFNEIELRHINETLERKIEERTWELQEKQALISAIIESSLDAIAFYKNIRDFYGKIIDFEFILANIQAHKYLERENIDLMGKKFFEEFPEYKKTDFFDNCIKVFSTGKTIEMEIKKNKQESTLYYHYTIVKLGDGLVMTISDTTKRKQAELTLQKINDELEIRVQERTKELQEKEEKLKAALQKEKELNEIKSRFISTVSHEFRTPLATIRSSSQMLQRYSEKLSAEEQTSYLAEIDDMCVRLTELLEDILYIRKAEASKIDFRPEVIDLQLISNEIIQQLLRLNDKKDRIVLEIFGEQNTLYLDKKLIRHVLTNLLTNALKFSPANTNIQLQLYFEKEYTLIKVIDQGYGIPENAKKNLFQPFFRAENIKNIQGTGLGLSIIKSCVESHGGRIFFDSKQGLGTTFTIELPVKTYNNIEK